MGESVYRRSPIGTFSSVFSDRYKLMRKKQHVDGRSVMDRNPAFIQLTGICNTCDGKGSRMTLPLEQDTWSEVYKNFKLSPIIESVSITFGGDFGLARRITGNIRCYDLDSFQNIQKHFLTPGNYIDATFGFSTENQWTPIDDAPHHLKNFRVATFSFTAGDGGTWVGTFTAVSAAEAIKSLDMHGGLNPNKLIKYTVAGEIDAEDDIFVSGISELISSDAQRNGTQKITEINKNSSGYVISTFVDYEKTDKSEVDAAIVVYTDDHLAKKFWGLRIGTTKVSHDWDEFVDSIHEIYVSLGYVVDRIVNGQIKKVLDIALGGTNDYDFEKLKIRFSPKYSRSFLPDFISTGNPLSVLILGSTRLRYYEGSGDTYMDFNELKGGDSPESVKAWDGSSLRTDRILLSKDVVMSALKESTINRSNESESVDPDDSNDTVVNLNDFFQRIFSEIKTCTGGAISLRLVIDPNDESGLSYLVVDQNYAGDQYIPCFIFDPVNGDGSTRDCNISSNGGSNEYRTSMFLANSKKGDVAANIRKCKGDLESARKKGWGLARDKYLQLVNYPGTIMKDKFDSKQMDSLTSVMVDFYRYAPPSNNKKENINWPGMEIDLTINGAYGIIPGCAISSTLTPRDWLDQGVYFMVREVTHNFQKSDWTTNIRGIMALYNYLNPVGGKGGGPE